MNSETNERDQAQSTAEDQTSSSVTGGEVQGVSLLALGESSIDKFFATVKSLKLPEQRGQYLIDITKSDQKLGILRICVLGTQTWFDIPVAALKSITPLSVSESEPTKLLADLVFEKEFGALDSSFRALALSSDSSRGQAPLLQEETIFRPFDNRRSERWTKWYEEEIPAGEFEVEHVYKSSWRTQVILDVKEQIYDLYVGMGAKRWFWLQNPQRVRFQLENDPIRSTVWLNQYRTNPSASPLGGTMVRWAFDTADIIFRYSYGGSGAGLTLGGARLPVGAIASLPNPDPSANGMSAVSHSTSPESWVRGSASLDRNNGIISYVMQLETDSVAQGPQGKMVVILYDAANTPLVRTEIDAGMGGKPPGKAVRRDFTAQKPIPTSIAQRVTRVDVSVQHTGAQTGLWGIDFGDVLNLIQLIILVAG